MMIPGGEQPSNFPPGMQQFMQNFQTTPELRLRTLQAQRKQLSLMVLIYKYTPVLMILGLVFGGIFLVSAAGWTNTWPLLGGIFPIILLRNQAKQVELEIERIDYQMDLVKQQISGAPS